MNDFSFSVDGPFSVPRSLSNTVLASTIAGSWYPADPARLAAMLNGAMDDAGVNEKAVFSNIFIVPHAGYAYSGPCAAHAYASVRASKRRFRKVILIAPSHRVYLDNALILPECDFVSTPLGNIAIDGEARKKLLESPFFEASDRVHREEHATQIQYPFLQCAIDGEFTVLPLIAGETDVDTARAAAETIAGVLDDETLVVISSDFTHYGRDFNYTPFPSDTAAKVKAVDFGAFDLYRSGNPDGFKTYIVENNATICGANPILISMFLKSGDAETTLLDYRTSTDGNGDHSRFVCYLSCAVKSDLSAVRKDAEKPSLIAEKKPALDESDKKALLAIARKSIRYAFENGRAPSGGEFSSEASENMKAAMGAFVTLKTKSNGMLRGCIGEIEPYRPLYRAVTARACDAAFRDPRFNPLTHEEYSLISIEISALTPAHPVRSWRDIVIGRHGMTVTKYGRSAVFLPQVAPEQGWDIEQTLSQLCLKAGLRPGDWREGASFTVFEAIVFGEDD